MDTCVSEGHLFFICALSLFSFLCCYGLTPLRITCPTPPSSPPRVFALFSSRVVSVACYVFYSSLDLYARNMADHHLVTDLLPPLARLFFLGHLNGAATTAPSDGGSSSSSSSSESGLSLSMVQKALLLGVGLQHRSVDDLALELNLPASQVKH